MNNVARTHIEDMHKKANCILFLEIAYDILEATTITGAQNTPESKNR